MDQLVRAVEDKCTNVVVDAKGLAVLEIDGIDPVDDRAAVLSILGDRDP